MKIKKDIIGKFLLFLYLFYMIYQPNFSYLIQVNNYIIYLFITCIFILHSLCVDKKMFKKYFSNKKIVLIVFLWILSMIYFLIRTSIEASNKGVILSFNDLRIIQNLYPILYLFGAIMVNESFNRYNFSKNDKIKFIINVCLFQSFIAILMVIFPSLKMVAIEIFRFTSGKNNFYIEQSRLYGICDGDYTYGLQIFHSIIAFFSFIYAYKTSEKKYYLYSIILFAVTILNGRSGILIFFLNFFFFIVYILFTKNGLVKFIKYAIVCIIIIFVGYSLIIKFLPNSYNIINHAINDFNSTLTGSDGTETGRYIEMFILPTGLNLIFGNGYRVIGKGGEKFGYNLSSDIGFSNDLFMGGIIYMLLLYSSYYFLISLTKEEKNEILDSFYPFLLISLCFANFKGEIFRQSIFITFIILYGIVFGKHSNSLRTKEKKLLIVKGRLYNE